MRINNINDYEKAYQLSVADPEGFWADIASEFTWKKKWTKVLEWDFKRPDVKWFIDGKLNITENCIDRHLSRKANDLAFIWEHYLFGTL
jgi:acetyl-CoA synthetase